MCIAILVGLLLFSIVSSKPGWFACLSRPPGHCHPSCRMRMKREPRRQCRRGLLRSESLAQKYLRHHYEQRPLPKSTAGRSALV
jgi:hypothetical protein